MSQLFDKWIQVKYILAPKKELHVIYTSNDLKFASVNSPQEVKEGYICRVYSRADF